MPDRIIPLIMCGGAGTRLWPLSREQYPKQFLKLFGPRSMFQDTILRVTNRDLFDRPCIITGEAHRFLVLEQLAEIESEADILLEPARRDSGPAIVAGTVFAQRRRPNAVILALASDHMVTDNNAFVAACKASLNAAAGGQIVTFGVQPTRPATEYGYISPGESIEAPLCIVRQFVEKPDITTATRYIENGYLWNSGNFMFRTDILLGEYGAADHRSIDAVMRAVQHAAADSPFLRLDKEAFESAVPTSIDYAVMERTKRAAVIPVSFGWSDIGSWQAVWDFSSKTSDGNAARGSAIFENSRGCMVVSEKTIVALNGVNDLAVIVTDDAVLVSHRSDSAGLKRLVSTLKATMRQAIDPHPKLHEK